MSMIGLNRIRIEMGYRLNEWKNQVLGVSIWIDIGELF